MPPPEDPLAGLGDRIRSLRKERRIKLNELAARTGLSDAFLSRLERGQVSSSVANLIQIAQVLDVAVGELFDGPQKSVMRSEGAVHTADKPNAEQNITSTGYRWRLLAGGMPNDDLEIFDLVFPRKHRMEMMVSHPGQEYCYVITGKVRFYVGEKAFELGPGEGILANSEIPHGAENIGSDEARVLMVVTKSPSDAEHFDWWKVPGSAAKTTNTLATTGEADTPDRRSRRIR